MASRGSMCCDWFLSYNSVRLVVMRNPKLGAVNRFIQLLVVLYSLFVLLDERQYMVKETPLGAQDIYGEVVKHGLSSLPSYCNNPEFDYYFNDFWRYDNVGCRPALPQQMLIPGTAEMFVVTAVEQRNVTLSSCTALACTEDTAITNYFTLEPENTAYVAFHHSYSTSWGANGYNIAADLVDVDGNVVASSPAGSPSRFLLSQYLSAAGISSLDARATYGGNGSTTVNPRIRLIGVNVGVYLEYSNVDSGWFSHAVVLRIKPFNRANGWAQLLRNPQYLDFPNKVISDTIQGVRMDFVVVGSVGTFDLSALVAWLVNTVVLMGVSRFVADLVAFNFLSDSERYRRRKAEDADAFYAASGGSDTHRLRGDGIEVPEVNANNRRRQATGGRSTDSAVVTTNPLPPV